MTGIGIRTYDELDILLHDQGVCRQQPHSRTSRQGQLFMPTPTSPRGQWWDRIVADVLLVLTLAHRSTLPIDQSQMLIVEFLVVDLFRRGGRSWPVAVTSKQAK